MKTHLLIDGDVIAFTAASAAQGVVDDCFGWSYPQAHRPTGEGIVENLLFTLKRDLSADSYEVVLSDPTSNWRHGVDPSYKGNRDPAMKPLILGAMKEYLREKHGAYHWANLEADDVLGIRATEPGRCVSCGEPRGGKPPCQPEARFVVVGRDKDFKSIPGLHHTFRVDPPGKVTEITTWQADRWHLIQTLAGDAVDGYRGCPGIGMARATEIIDDPKVLRPTSTKVTRGPRKGEDNVTWVPEPTGDHWACVVSHYEKGYSGYAGVDPTPQDHALVTARLARILRHGEYDRETGKVKLWEPYGGHLR